MKLIFSMLCVIGLLVVGCDRGQSGEQSTAGHDPLNAPLTIEEAHAMMRALDDELAGSDMPPDAAASVRGKMMGRLLGAGVPEEGIHDWINGRWGGPE